MSNVKDKIIIELYEKYRRENAEAINETYKTKAMD
jgi:hypothetical protein